MATQSPSITLIKGSDGSGNASVATVQNSRSPGATTIIVNTVAGIPAKFYGTMGEPHTFVDPVTSETITVISDATAVDFEGHVSGGNLEIDLISPGYLDTRGSLVGDIVVVRPTSEYANNIARVLAVSLNDDGSLKSVTPNQGWTDLGRIPNSATENGNRSITHVYNSIDLTPFLSVGMRERFTRSVAGNTYMGGLLNGSTQYFTRTSANLGATALATITDNFTIMAWVQPTSYADGDIACRADAAVNNAIELRMDSSGRVLCTVFNGGVANFRAVTTYQSLPLNKRTHVAASWASGTVVIYFDGISVPVQAATTGGTAPTTAGTGGDFSIGRRGASGTFFFPGYISGVGVFNAVLSAATIRSYKNQKLTGSETNNIGAWSLDNVLTDANAAGNNLSAVASAGFTNISPYGSDASNKPTGTYEWGIIQQITYSGGNTTIVTQYPEGSAIPTSGGLSKVEYSGVKAPFGMPVDKFRWSISAILRSNVSTTSSSYGTSNFQIGGQTGQWDVYASALLSCIDTAATTDTGMDCALSTSTSAVSDENLHFFSYFNGASSANLTVTNRATAQTTVNLSAPTTYYMIYKTNGSTTATIAGTTAQADIVFTPSNL